MSIPERFVSSWFPMAIAQLGLAILLVAGVYRWSRLSIPCPPEAPIELLLQYDRNQRFVRTLSRVGTVAVVGGLALAAAQAMVRRTSWRTSGNREAPPRSAGPSAAR